MVTYPGLSTTQVDDFFFSSITIDNTTENKVCYLWYKLGRIPMRVCYLKLGILINFKSYPTPGLPMTNSSKFKVSLCISFLNIRSSSTFKETNHQHLVKSRLPFPVATCCIVHSFMWILISWNNPSRRVYNSASSERKF